jgi:hypothetical protein
VLIYEENGFGVWAVGQVLREFGRVATWGDEEGGHLVFPRVVWRRVDGFIQLTNVGVVVYSMSLARWGGCR